jgi:CBS domain-containing protein
MIVADVMTRDVPACRIGDTLNQAVQLMWDGRCAAVPVLDDGRRIVGVVTDRDACMAAYTQGAKLADVPLSSAMSPSVVACLPTASVEEAENLMMVYDVRRLAVMDPNERFLGMVSLDDIAAEGIARINRRDGIDLRRVGLTLGEIAHQQRGTRPRPLVDERTARDVAAVKADRRYAGAGSASSAP